MITYEYEVGMAYEQHPDDLTALVEAYSEVLGTNFRGVSSAADAHLRDLQQASDLGRANWQLVQDGIGILPSATSDPRSMYQHHGACFLPESSDQANGVLASVVWLPDAKRDPSDDTPGGEPFYIAGRCAVGQSVELLLASASPGSAPYGHAIKTIIVRDSEGADATLLAMQSRMGSGMPLEEIDELYDDVLGRPIIDRESRGSVNLVTARLRWPFSGDDSRPQIHVKGQPKPWGDVGRLDPGDVERFGVVEYLAGLAVNFGVARALMGVISRHLKPPERSNLERYVLGQE